MHTPYCHFLVFIKRRSFTKPRRSRAMLRLPRYAVGFKLWQWGHDEVRDGDAYLTEPAAIIIPRELPRAAA